MPIRPHSMEVPMTKSMSSLSIAFLLILSAHAAQAQATRTFVSASGSDANSCARPTPCRTFASALSKTNPGGEINVLDPAGFGTVVIDRAISIVNDGVGSAGILVPTGGTGITINAGANDAVNLRGLIIEGAGNGQTGIVFTIGKSLTITNCVIRDFTSRSIDFIPSGASVLFVSDTQVSNNGNDGILVSPSGTGTAKAVLDRVAANGNVLHGIAITNATTTGAVNAIVADSVAANNGGMGFFVGSGSGPATTSVLLVRSVAYSNNTGLAANGASATLRVAQSTVTRNTTGWSTVSGTLLSYGDNTIDDNVGGQVAPPSGLVK
jgi:hypothetical protein